MKFLKLAVAAVLALGFGSASAQQVKFKLPGDVNQQVGGAAAPGFHMGGVAACEGCHVMHNANGGVGITTAGGTGAAIRSNTTNSYLLQGSDQSSTCLICHAGPAGAAQFTVLDTTAGDMSTTTTNFTPGGDFKWTLAPITAGFNAARRGHNVVAADFSMVQDPQLNTVAPGGTFAPAATGKAAFACSNCHDPHGRYRMTGTATSYTISNTGAAIVDSGSYGSPTPNARNISATQALGVYRLLGGRNYSPASNPRFPFPNDPPVAVAPVAYNANESAGETRVAYGAGMSEWCQNCHTNIHLDGYVTGAPGLRHPAGTGAKFQGLQIDAYNKYVASGKLTATARYLSLVPFETNVTNIDSANPGSGLGSGAGTGVNPLTAETGILVAKASSNVMCLSCHRAHASGFESIARWDNADTFITGDTALVSPASMVSSNQATVAYYLRPVASADPSANYGFGPFQRSLCNKCHAKD
jgi:hypothetical protein